VITHAQQQICTVNVYRWLQRLYRAGAGPVVLIGSDSPTEMNEITLVGADGLTDELLAEVLAEALRVVRQRIAGRIADDTAGGKAVRP